MAKVHTCLKSHLVHIAMAYLSNFSLVCNKIINSIFISICTENGRYIACMCYIEIPQEVTNENTITLVYYLAQQKL